MRLFIERNDAAMSRCSLALREPPSVEAGDLGELDRSFLEVRKGRTVKG